MKLFIVLAAVLAVAKPQGFWGSYIPYMDNTQGVPATASCMGSTGWPAGYPCIIPVYPGPNPRPPTTVVEPNPPCPQLSSPCSQAEKRFSCYAPLYSSSYRQPGAYPVPVVGPGGGAHVPSWGHGGPTWGGNTILPGWGM